MNRVAKRVFKWIFVVVMLGAVAYGGYMAYNYILEDAIKKIQKGVSKGVRKGIGKTVRTVINPFKWFRRSKETDNFNRE